MSILTQDHLLFVRQQAAHDMPAVNYTKPQINAAAQAVEDWFEVNRPALSTAIDLATSPLVLTNAQKKQLVKWWFMLKFNRGG